MRTEKAVCAKALLQSRPQKARKHLAIAGQESTLSLLVEKKPSASAKEMVGAAGAEDAKPQDKFRFDQRTSILGRLATATQKLVRQR